MPTTVQDIQTTLAYLDLIFPQDVPVQFVYSKKTQDYEYVVAKPLRVGYITDQLLIQVISETMEFYNEGYSTWEVNSIEDVKATFAAWIPLLRLQILKALQEPQVA